MEEAVEVMALKQCYHVLGEFSVNQIVMFVMILILFAIIIGLVIMINKLQSRIRVLESDKQELVLRISKKEKEIRKAIRNELRRETKGN